MPYTNELLRNVLPEELKPFADGVVGADDPRPIWHPDELLSDAHRAAMIRRFDGRYGTTDPRAVVSIWSAWYFTTVLPGIVGLSLFGDMTLDLSLDALRFVVSEDQRVAAVRVASAPIPSPRGPDRFRSMIEDHLGPFVELVAERGHVSRRVVWSNAGSTFDAFLAKARPYAEGLEAYRDARNLLAERTVASGRNPLFEPVRILAGKRVRRVCCMRFMVPDGRLCASCPLPPVSAVRLRMEARAI